MNGKPVNTITVLVGLYIACQLIADVAATKIVSVWGIAMPAGTLIFAVTFTLRDMLHKRLGKNWAKAAIYTAGVMNVILAMYMFGASQLPAAPFFSFTEWDQIFAIVPAVTLGSIIAEVVSELVDTEIYHWFRVRTTGFWQVTGVFWSNLVALFIDSLIFALAAFVVLPGAFGATALPMSAAFSIVFGQIVYKIAVSVLSVPLIYTVQDKRSLTEAV